ncbi:MAG TPA: ABC transporter permease [Dehalococcoidia bacterium]|nr:ABC transporter permease [Dehalococcoidia bacterium]
MAAVTGASARALAWRDAEVAPRSYFGEVRGRFLRNRAGVAALCVLVVLTLGAIAGPFLIAADPLVGQATQRLLPIGSTGHLLGTDELGRDMLSRLVYGGRVSLITGLLPVALATFVGTLIGATAGYIRGYVGSLMMRTMDMFYALPAIMLAIAISASLGPGVENSIIAISCVFIPPLARVAEAATRQVVHLEYIEAARASGANTWQILTRQILANIFNPIFVYASGLVGLSIVIASGLSFLGLGSAPPQPEWGYMLNSLRGAIYTQPWVAVLPGFLIFATSMACNIVSDALRDALDIKEA